MSRRHIGLWSGLLLGASICFWLWHGARREAPRPAVVAPAASTAPRTAPLPVEPMPEPSEPQKVRPHPITPQPEAMAAQHALLGEIEAALDARDIARARELLDEHRRRFAGPDGWQDQREGFEIVVDCLEHPGEASRLRGQRFVDENRGSTLRRRVRRACLGP